MDTKLLDRIQRAIFLFIALFLIWLFFAPKSYGQCQRSTPFTADFNFQTSGQRLNASVNLGFFNSTSISVQGGARMYDTREEGKANAQKVFTIPTATVLLKHRYNGIYSDVVHALALTAGTNNYREIGYRLYNAPTENSFATIGWTASYSNVQGFTAGFIIMAIF
jgi:hypothetical protein